jgi:MFS transporter, ACS family, pantothenate transporter
MTKPSVNTVAVIGAGISGVVTAAHLLSAGLEVTVFERSREAGGVWYVRSSYFCCAENRG